VATDRLEEPAEPETVEEAARSLNEGAEKTP